MAKNISSIEEQIEDWCKHQLQGKTQYFTKTEPINSEIEKALKEAPSKQGGSGNNYPDIKCLIQTEQMRRIPVMIEVKGTKGDFIKLADGEIANFNKKGECLYNNIAKYAVNGAIHYAHAILHHSDSYDEVIAISHRKPILIWCCSAL